MCACRSTPANARVTDTPPYFAPVEVTLPDFPYTWKTTFGGSSAEYAADSTVLADGTLATVGQTYSFDGDVEGLQRGPSNAYVNIRDAAGNSLKTIELGGLENTTRPTRQASTPQPMAGSTCAAVSPPPTARRRAISPRSIATGRCSGRPTPS